MGAVVHHSNALTLLARRFGEWIAWAGYGGWTDLHHPTNPRANITALQRGFVEPHRISMGYPSIWLDLTHRDAFTLDGVGPKFWMRAMG
ncbi:hypothetical protein RZS08_56140, partial [Arthrospira platensis SPKY1]|nr:hypothetical protein [Arthrospira platensis SPKY1]